MSSLQQLSLYATVQSSKIPQLLFTVSALTGMRPLDLRQQHIIFSPTISGHGPGSSAGVAGGPAGAVSPLESSRIDVSREMPEAAAAAEDGVGKSEAPEWTLTIPTIPESGKKPVQVQAVSKTTFRKSEEAQADNTSTLFRFLRALNYAYAYDYLEKGYLFVHNGIVIIKLSQIAPQKPLQLHEIPVGGDGDLAAGTVANGRRFENAKFVNTWVMHAYVEVVTGPETVGDDLEKVKIAIERLESLKAELSGIVELEIPDRALLDPRVQLRR
ncbi:Med18 protein-domain-containing protein [Myxozyma melibiosi]|uniref:Mediator of RNA polymerase II transcription subunit 18 n=1 Tax=Myxozyma melibiosi TaxID=54550 RepID=A0ABR1F1V5_9ASCO